MADQRRGGIAWCDTTWNPIRGCSRVSEGCENCYAEAIAARFSGPGQPFEGYARRRSTGEPAWTGKVALIPELLTLPLRWRRPRRVFVNSMSDLFHESLSDEAIDQVFAVMALAGRHTFQVLTKRPERMLQYMTDAAVRERLTSVTAATASILKAWDGISRAQDDRIVWPLPNVWLGVSVEDQQRFDERIVELAQTPAAVRFLSLEPLLEEIEFGNALDDPPADSPYARPDWVIVGGESGPGARPCAVEWVHSIVQQCRAAGVACFVKQLGADPGHAGPDGLSPSPIRYKLRDKKGGDPAEWPEDLRVREWPKAPAEERP